MLFSLSLSSSFSTCPDTPRSSIRIWTLSGECLQELYGHSNFIYSLAAFTPDMHDSLADTILASSGEDRSCHIWKGAALFPHAKVEQANQYFEISSG
jgi:WD40 repeat protein